MADREEKKEIKVILVGEPGTGKTCLINVATGGKFSQNMDSTIDSTFVTKKIVKDNKEYSLNLWDTAGQEKYHSVTRLFLKNSEIVIFVYAINEKQTFEGMKSYWVTTIKESVGDEPILGIVGNKNDLYIQEDVSEEEGKDFANKLGAKFKLVSAKEDPLGFINFLEELLDEFLKKRGMDVKKKDNTNININFEKPKKKKRKIC
jgi:small GTP-binding protein